MVTVHCDSGPLRLSGPRTTMGSLYGLPLVIPLRTPSLRLPGRVRAFLFLVPIPSSLSEKGAGGKALQHARASALSPSPRFRDP